MVGTLERRREDTIFRSFVVIALLLEIVVVIEPAPVDGVIVVALIAGLVLGKLAFPTLGVVPVIALVVFGLANLVSMYDVPAPDRAFLYLLVTFYLVASWFFFVGVAGRYGKPFVATMIDTYCIAGVISAILGIGAYFGVMPYTSQLLLAGRARGLFKDCNVYGPFFVPVALFALTRVLDAHTSRREKLIPILVMTASALATFLCFSRACWINFVLALAVFLVGQVAFPGLRIQLSRQDLRRRITVAAGVLALGSISMVFLMALPSISEMLAQRVTSSGLQSYDRVRFATQTLALETAEKHPLGLGPGQVEELFDYSTHSMYVRILSENGVIALLALLIFIGATMARSISVIERAEDPWFREMNLVVLACIVGHLVNSFVIDTVHWRHIWFIYALPWSPVSLRKYPLRAATALSRVRTRHQPVFAAPGFPGR